MEKIKTKTKEFELVALGITSSASALSVKFLPGENTLETINNIFSDAEETETITLESESGEALSIYSGYTVITSIALDYNAVIGHETAEDGESVEVTGKAVSITLQKPDAVTTRINNLEKSYDLTSEDITDIQMAMADLYEIIMEG